MKHVLLFKVFQLFNYKSVAELLKERFADTQVIIQDVLSLKSAPSSHDILCVQKIYDAVDIHTKNVVPFDTNMDHYGPMLVSVLLNKLPEDFKIEIS